MGPISRGHADYDRCCTWRPIRAEGRSTPISLTRTATVVIHERARSLTNRGPPGSRSRHLGIKRDLHSVAVCRSRCAFRLFSRNRVVLCRSRLVVLGKYEAQSEACWTLSVDIGRRSLSALSEFDFLRVLSLNFPARITLTLRRMVQPWP
jgi:hypothetical protein